MTAPHRSTMPPRPLSISRSAAAKIIDELRIEDPREIDIVLIAARANLFVQFRSLAHEAGHILRTAKAGLLTVHQEARHSNWWRSIIAHELGHFIRHPQVNQFVVCTDANLRDYHSSGNEVEANEFAAEVLMPEHLFKRYCDRNRPSLKDVREINAIFRTSMTSTAVRFVTFTDEPVAVVHSTNGAVDWCRRTENFPLFIPRGHRLTTMTYAGDLFAGNPVDDRPQLIDGAGWSDNTRARDVDLQEHSIRLGSFGSVLTMLWHKWQ